MPESKFWEDRRRNLRGVEYTEASNDATAELGQRAATILLLDIDGTLSPLPLRGNDNDHDYTLHYTDGSTYQVSARWAPFTGPEWLCVSGFGPVPFRPALVAKLNTLIESGTVTPRWLTTWDDTANTLGETGLISLPWPVERRGTGRIGGKIDAVQRVLTENPSARVVWCDDAIDPRMAEVKDLKTQFVERLLIIRPKRSYGLTDAHLDVMAQFARP